MKKPADQGESERNELFFSDKLLKAHLSHRPDEGGKNENAHYGPDGAIVKERRARKKVDLLRS